METYLDAHAAFVSWLDAAAERQPSAADVEQAMLEPAVCATGRGMTGEHWRFVVDELVAHAQRRCPDHPGLPALVGRGVELAGRWNSIARARP